MDIAPIAPSIPMPVFDHVPAVLEPPPMERLDSSARTGDETYSPSDRRQQRGSADSSDEEPASDAESEASNGEGRMNLAARDGFVEGQAINFFV